MTTNALSMVDQVLAGYAYRYYFAREIYYTGTQTGPHVMVWLSDGIPILTGANSISLGGGVRVDCYTNMTTNVGAQRYAVVNYAGGIVSWGAQDLVLSDCLPATIGGVVFDLPDSHIRQNVQANRASTAAVFADVLLLFFVCVAVFWGMFRKR